MSRVADAYSRASGHDPAVDLLEGTDHPRGDALSGFNRATAPPRDEFAPFEPDDGSVRPPPGLSPIRDPASRPPGGPMSNGRSMRRRRCRARATATPSSGTCPAWSTACSCRSAASRSAASPSRRPAPKPTRVAHRDGGGDARRADDTDRLRRRRQFPDAVAARAFRAADRRGVCGGARVGRAAGRLCPADAAQPVGGARRDRHRRSVVRAAPPRGSGWRSSWRSSTMCLSTSSRLTAGNDVGGLLRLVGGVIVVVAADSTRREAARRATQALAESGVTVIGAVLTNQRCRFRTARIDCCNARTHDSSAWNLDRMATLAGSPLIRPSADGRLGASQDARGPPIADRRPITAGRLIAALETCVALAALAGVLIVTNLRSMPQGLDNFLSMRVTLRNVLLLAMLAAGWPLIFRAVRAVYGGAGPRIRGASGCGSSSPARWGRCSPWSFPRSAAAAA